MSIPLLIQASGNAVTGPTVRIPMGDWVFFIEGKYVKLHVFLDGEGPTPIPSLITISKFSNLRICGEGLDCVTVKMRENKGNGT